MNLQQRQVEMRPKLEKFVLMQGIRRPKNYNYVYTMISKMLMPTEGVICKRGKPFMAKI